MIEKEAMYKLTYGLFVLTCRDGKDNGCIVNTVQQVTVDPCVISVAVNKSNHTHDMIVRTGGDLRISNFLLWQAAYAELYFTEKLWPDLTPADVDDMIRDFYSRKRRYGGL